MSLASNVESLLKRALTPEEVANLSTFQQFHGIDDSDPLIVVLALMAKNQILVESLPDLLQQKAKETIALHQQTLLEQSTLIAKTLITTVASHIQMSNEEWKMRWLRYAGCFVGGAVTAGIILRLYGH